MFINSFDDLRAYLLQNTNIQTMAHLGTDAFDEIGGEVVNTTMYTLQKNGIPKKSSFIRLVDYEYEEKLPELRKGIEKRTNQYCTSQDSFNAIPDSPFVYWISDNLRETFKAEEPLKKIAEARQGCATGNNARCLRLWWEVEKDSTTHHYEQEKNKWVPYAKGGPEEKWYGNLWWVIDYSKSGYSYLKNHGNKLPSETYYFKEGISCTKVGTDGTSATYMPEGFIFDQNIYAIFSSEVKKEYLLAFLNSNLMGLLLLTLNPTQNTVGADFSRLPLRIPGESRELKLVTLTGGNITVKKHLCTFSLIERNFQHTPIDWAKEKADTYSIDQGAKVYINYELTQEAKVLINESVIDEEIFKLYELGDKDIQAIFKRKGKPAGYQPLLYEDDLNYLPEGKLLDDEFDLTEEDIEKIENLREDYASSLPVYDLQDEEKLGKENEILDLYDDNKDLRDICTEAEVNPLSVLRIVKETNQVPLKKGREIVHEFLFDKVLKILRKDPDGIVPLSFQTGDDTVYQKLQRKLDDLGYETYEGFESYLKRGRTLEDWLYKDFFKAHAKRFSYRTYKGAIVWYLTSGKKNGFDVYVLHHKWSQDNLKKLRTVYLSNRKEFLENRLAQLDRDEQDKEWRKRREQLDEVEEMEEKLKELENDPEYEPEVDDGVGKNIAPLQDKGLTSYDILSKKQKKKYLEADW